MSANLKPTPNAAAAAPVNTHTPTAPIQDSATVDSNGPQCAHCGWRGGSHASNCPFKAGGGVRRCANRWVGDASRPTLKFEMDAEKDEKVDEGVEVGGGVTGAGGFAEASVDIDDAQSAKGAADVAAQRLELLDERRLRRSTHGVRQRTAPA
ncbi:hypothetical protein B0H15DRAFT_1027813 [Mycena belliarum]|uniref:Uncharacterized protein n=1 Tax=Mycena belliarum TaxID=1033014 RepID=A0AAD6TP00_9AGAR|nr:hypothetical protein B0H15DRAFT_1027813 [Mycena belliae]